MQQRGQTPHVSQDRGQELIGILNAEELYMHKLVCRRRNSAALNWQTHVLQVASESGRLVRDRLLEREQQESFPLRVCRGVNLLDIDQCSAAGQTFLLSD